MGSLQVFLGWGQPFLIQSSLQLYGYSVSLTEGQPYRHESYSLEYSGSKGLYSSAPLGLMSSIWTLQEGSVTRDFLWGSPHCTEVSPAQCSCYLDKAAPTTLMRTGNGGICGCKKKRGPLGNQTWGPGMVDGLQCAKLSHSKNCPTQPSNALLEIDLGEKIVYSYWA